LQAYSHCDFYDEQNIDLEFQGCGTWKLLYFDPGNGNVEDNVKNTVKVKVIEIGHYIGVAWETQIGSQSAQE
jgi:hypothetical protein